MFIPIEDFDVEALHQCAPGSIVFRVIGNVVYVFSLN